MKLYNTLSRTEETLPSPQEKKTISFYACGPTVYDETHIGHMRKYVMDDILRRTLEYLGYDVKHVMNITDVGHLTGDDDIGEDKMEKGAKKQGKTVWDIARQYEEKFWTTMDALNIQHPNTPANMPQGTRATEHIQEMIQLIQKLEAKGFTYQTEEAIYFDVTKFENYGKLSGQKLEDKMQAVRDEVNVDPQKKHPADFALWFFRKGRFADHTMHWESPWGVGFPGWHIECSAMSMEYLGEQIDIHSGGIDHIPVHHENEIAQSEAASGKSPFVKYWVHHAFLQVAGEKMSKSKGNFYTLKDITDKNIDPMAIRYLFLQTHYRKPMNFTWEALKAAQKAYKNLLTTAMALGEFKSNLNFNPENKLYKELKLEFKNAISDDLNTSKSLSILWKALESNVYAPYQKELLLSFDNVFNLGLIKLLENHHSPIAISNEVTNLAEQRKAAKINKDYQKSDELRKQIEEAGYLIEDTADGYVIKKK